MKLVNCIYECICGTQTPILKSEQASFTCTGCRRYITISHVSIEFFEADSKNCESKEKVNELA